MDSTVTVKKNGEYLICPNKKSCQPQIIGRINRWIKENKIMEWGESILTKLVESGKITPSFAELRGLIINVTPEMLSQLDERGSGKE
jgi:NAD-dependent DNA ligase